jgi:hypothetical protein
VLTGAGSHLLAPSAVQDTLVLSGTIAVCTTLILLYIIVR